MKKFVVTIAALGFCFSGIAQDKKEVKLAGIDISAQPPKVEPAKEHIDKAFQSPEDPKELPHALFVKAEVYMAMQEMDQYKAQNPYREATQALYKLVAAKPDYEKDNVAGMFMFAGMLYYNDAVKAYNDKKLQEASDLMKNVVKIKGLVDVSKMPIPDANKKRLDTIYAAADQIIANSAYYSGKYEEAIPLLTAVKNNPITKNSAVYNSLADAYTHTNNASEAGKVIEEGRKLYPDDPALRNTEVNAAMHSGKQDEIIKKLEQESAKDPNNADLLFNLATTYLNMANPTGGAKPANAAELNAKAEDAFQRALKIQPHNEIFNYNFGVLYFNEAKAATDEMNAINGTTDADMKKYDDLKAKRDGLFTKSLPYFEEAYNQYASKESSLRDKDKETYRNTVIALKEVYARTGKTDKSAEMKKKLDTL